MDLFVLFPLDENTLWWSAFQLGLLVECTVVITVDGIALAFLLDAVCASVTTNNKAIVWQRFLCKCILVPPFF